MTLASIGKVETSIRSTTKKFKTVSSNGMILRCNNLMKNFGRESLTSTNILDNLIHGQTAQPKLMTQSTVKHHGESPHSLASQRSQEVPKDNLLPSKNVTSFQISHTTTQLRRCANLKIGKC